MARDGNTKRRRLLGPAAALLLAGGAELIGPSKVLAHRCVGDCDGSDSVSVGELVVGVRIALERAPLFTCLPYDADFDHRVSIDELLVAVNNAFTFCGHGPPGSTSTPAPSETPTPGETPPPQPTATP